MQRVSTAASHDAAGACDRPGQRGARLMLYGRRSKLEARGEGVVHYRLKSFGNGAEGVCAVKLCV
ncbi:hypothetical protein LMJF_12_0515 [Leishmania major strain Friedlin]|uniref:Uncharacterized protein n=1 Tax=Leishmania major TaxID=5664 RepID=E9ACR3_LEIMA|nr:hypothetical protein LMJF_12_0515 [Leishmania major strain Friedlin]CBZ05805.1 hypothetical protein LMJF_12_0515 [Leishmania major strain Friedlin]|eukprot:XP_003721787.1 hypothetical protein LMJF_12_0515 [Leishmania major strain Friedlin]